MAGIPKKVIDRFLKTVPRFQEVLQKAKDRDVNESDTVSILNDVFGEVLGYDKYLEVTSELAIRGTYCDLAIKVDEKIQFLIEVKAIGIDLKDTHMRQAIDYGANHGVQWVILTNGIDWNIYRIRFEQPINYDLVCCFNFSILDPNGEKEQEILFMLSKEGLIKNARDDFYEKAQSVNRYVIGSLILSEPVLELLRRELKKLSEGLKVEVEEIEQLIKAEILKREVVEGEEAEAARSRVNRYYRKSGPRRRQKEAEQVEQVASTKEEARIEILPKEGQREKDSLDKTPEDK